MLKMSSSLVEALLFWASAQTLVRRRCPSHAQEQLVRRIGECRFRRRAQVRTPLDKPHKGMRIDQEFHSMYSLNSSSGSSKSGAM
jgi:hypothetical protein